MYEFTYSKASSVEDAASQFGEAEEGKFMSGGMTLLPTLKQRLARPSNVIDLAQLPEMAGIDVSADTVSIKAMTCHAAVASSPHVQKAIPALAKLAGGIGDPMVRNRGTIGGSLANNDPAADYPGSVVGLGATIPVSYTHLTLPTKRIV